MAWGRVRRWLPLAGLAAIIWLGLYIMFWMDRADCTGPVASCLGNAFGNWLGDVVMMRWVKSHQTLIGGLLAFGAGAFVILDGWRNRTQAAQERRIGRYERSFTTIKVIGSQLSRLHDEAMQVANGGNSVAVRTAHLTNFRIELEALQAHVPEATLVGGEFSEWLLSAVTQIRDQLRIAAAPTGSARDASLLLVVTWANSIVVKSPDRLIDEDGYYRRHLIVLDATEREVLSAAKVDLDEIWSARRYLSFDGHHAAPPGR